MSSCLTRPSNLLVPKREFVSDGTRARFININGAWHMSLAPRLAAIVQIGTTVTCDVETRAGRCYARSGTVIQIQPLADGTRRALCRLEEYRAGRARDERNTFAHLPDGSWGVRLHASASRGCRLGDTLRIAVTAKSGRVEHVAARVARIVENEQGDRQAIAEIVERERGRERLYDPDDGVTRPCPSCGTVACDSGIAGECRLTPDDHPNTRADIPMADLPREDLDSRIEPIGAAQDWNHWSARIGRGEYVRIAP